jgi:hypothetical protein
MPFGPDVSLSAGLRADEFVLRPITAADARFDCEAVMDSREYLRQWEQSTWPEDDFTVADNQSDLVDLERWNSASLAFTYTILDPSESRCLGCVYILPGRDVPQPQRVQPDSRRRGGVVGHRRGRLSLGSQAGDGRRDGCDRADRTGRMDPTGDGIRPHRIRHERPVRSTDGPVPAIRVRPGVQEPPARRRRDSLRLRATGFESEADEHTALKGLAPQSPDPR